MIRWSAWMAAVLGVPACAQQPRLPELVLSPAAREFVGCYRVSLATQSRVVPTQFDVRLDTTEAINGWQVRTLSAMSKEVEGLGFSWLMVGNTLQVRSWAGREGQGMRVVVGGQDTLSGTANWYLHFDRSDRDSALAKMVRLSCP